MRITMITGESFIYGKRKTNNTITRKEISSLTNNVDYYLNCVYISVEKVGYRLVVIHNQEVLTNRCYTICKSAKIAFALMYNRKAWKKRVIPKWSCWYFPGDDFIKEKTVLLRSRNIKARF
jgi:hypothetical protein